MTKNKNHIDFLEGKLKDETLEQFYRELDENGNSLEELAETVIKEYGRTKLKEKFREIHSNIDAGKNSSRPLYFKVAATIIIVFGIAFLVYHSTSPDDKNNITRVQQEKTLPIHEQTVKNNDSAPIQHYEHETKNDGEETLIAEAGLEKTYTGKELFSHYFAPYDKPVYRSSEAAIDLAFTLYKQQKYHEALAEFRKVMQTLDNDKEINEALFYSSICMLADSSVSYMDDAKQYLVSVHNDADSNLNEEAGWFMALLYLKMEEKEKAKEILTNIVSKKSFNYKQAELLLEKL